MSTRTQNMYKTGHFLSLVEGILSKPMASELSFQLVSFLVVILMHCSPLSV
jgi:hypothetical protein